MCQMTCKVSVKKQVNYGIFRKVTLHTVYQTQCLKCSKMLSVYFYIYDKSNSYLIGKEIEATKFYIHMAPTLIRWWKICDTNWKQKEAAQSNDDSNEQTSSVDFCVYFFLITFLRKWN